MDPTVEAALISGGATLVSVGLTAAVAIVGLKVSRSANQATIDAAQDTNKRTIKAAHADINETLAAMRDGQITDRYTKAIEQLGSSTIDVAIGGIYALERIARDSPQDHPTVIEVLSAYIREHSREQWPNPGPDGTAPEQATRPDIQASLTVIGRRDSAYEIRPINLSGADLTRADLTDANLDHANLAHANLTHANLTHANLANANFFRAHLTDANLFRCTSLDGAEFLYADLTNASLSATDPSGANFIHANLTEAVWPHDVAAPLGWKQDPGSGQLTRTGIAHERGEVK